MTFSPALWDGLGTTLFISTVSLLICIIPGLLLFMAKRSKVKSLNLLSTAYMEFFQGIPLLAQLLFVYYGLPMAFPDLLLSSTTAAFIVLSLNGGAYIASFARRYTHHIENISDVSTMLKLMTLSAIPVFSEMIQCTTLLSILGEKDLLRTANILSTSTNDVSNIVFAICIYLFLSILFKLLHEQVHIKRHDNFFRMTAVITACLHWFNPLVWIFLRYYFADLELSCDSIVLKSLSPQQTKEYAYTLLDSHATKPWLRSAFGGADTKLRIEKILTYQRTTLFSLVCLIIFALIVAVILLTNANG